VVTGAPTRVFVARLAGLAVFDPLGDQVGRVRDLVVVFSARRPTPRAVGLVVEVPGRRRVFVPMTRVTSMDAGQVITTGLVNMRRFEQRPTETLVLGEMLDRTVELRETSEPVIVEDVGIEQGHRGEWHVTRVFVRRGRAGRLRRRGGETFVVPFEDVTGFGVVEQRQGAANLLAAFDELKAADLAEMIHELTRKRRLEVAAALDDERLADVLEELPEDDQVEILSELGSERAADVLEAMQPDDAADLLSELPQDQAEQLLQLMEPDEADDVRRLLAYDERTAGGMMTPEPIILSPEATVAEALAHVRRQEISPALAAAVYVCRPPLEVPTGRYLGLAHIQRLLRESPRELIGTMLDKDVEPLPVHTELPAITRRLATYNLVAVPVTDDAGRLVGVVTVDDVLDHLLPDDWREADDDLMADLPNGATAPTLPEVHRGG
jgi:CBS domain-containing protein